MIEDSTIEISAIEISMISEDITTEEDTATSTDFHFTAGFHPVDLRLEAFRTFELNVQESLG